MDGNERWITLDLADLARLTNGDSIRVRLRDSDIEVVLWGGEDVRRVVQSVRTKTQARSNGKERKTTS